ncbi:uncharacterized protein LAESUDRAFT_758804 [Laetiporus sulphureus 93-53]|uniref:DUF6533 domain-containing protein n=1 Tax=Laetiporus sulphureus 93-53 TaxID=1314785 RepID=A0A165EG68_9APHY|nr:uncharacterized protein LAESUDRAFT_758804 [Laetiporus sulphureus 93-53]KZT06992.1 hypothetical protein LAESUDRAFT_758804 [Laetiporus sulphureus 93-53]
MSPEDTALTYVEVYLVFKNHFFFTVTVLCCYDYILTLDREIKFIWKADLSFATSLYYAFRYAALCNTIMYVLLMDTTLWFAFLCVINVIGIAKGRMIEFVDIWQIWTGIFSSMLLSRLVLDLREAAAAGIESEGTFSYAQWDLAFAPEEEGSVGELDDVVTEASHRMES